MRTAIAAAAAAVLVLSGCGGGDDEPQAQGSAKPATSTSAEDTLPVYTYGLDDTATGPAPEVPGATKGGVVKVYNSFDYTHLDPARIYSNDEQVVSQLFTRTLTTYRLSLIHI